MIHPADDLKSTRDHLIAAFHLREPHPDITDRLTGIIDQYFRRSLQESRAGCYLFKKKVPFAFVAVGGYGREELCLHSDIDILILFDRAIPKKTKALAEEILYPLWDLGLDLGYGTRTIKDCLKLSKDDFEVLTSMLDARFICGDSPLYLSLIESIYKKIVPKRAIPLSRWLKVQDKHRMAKFGDASYLLEPNLKDGIGGLRDYHHILWLAKVFFQLKIPRDLEYMGKFSHVEYEDLKKHLAFILTTRNHLHHLSGRRSDRLIFEYQEEIAHLSGFRDKRDYKSVEQFMGRLHASMMSLKSLHRSFLANQIPSPSQKERECQSDVPLEGLHCRQGELHFDSATAILSHPLLLLKIFDQSAPTGYPLSLEAKRLVREFLFLVDDPFRESVVSIEGFLNIINSQGTFDALDQMLETGFLCALVPEFGLIRDRVQFDAYHIFPVGLHLLQTIKHLKSFTNERDLLLYDIFSDLSNPETLFLAGLFHDIGKIGRNHAKRGVNITRNLLTRFGYEKSATEDVLFLVGHHLLLVETATRRDLNDEKVIVQCAQTIGEIERLKMLYLLTWADSRATGPRAWNEWTSNLIQELFFKILHTLERGELATKNASRKINRTLSHVRHKMQKKMDDSLLENFFEAMSPRYLLETKAVDVVRHLTMLQKGFLGLNNPANDAFILDARNVEAEGCWEVTFMAKDRPGLFLNVAGVLALHNINILSAHIYTWRDGTAIDLFKVTRPLDPFHSDEIWEKIRRDLQSIFKSKLLLDERLRQKAEPSIISHKKNPKKPPKVLINNESSDFFNVIEVFADDRVGLLYQITSELHGLRLDIRIAKIATKGDQIADIFYVRDLEGQKVEDEAHMKEIERTLLHRLGHP